MSLKKLHGQRIKERFTAKQATTSRFCGYVAAIEREEATQIRRTVKEAENAGCGDGGLPSKMHAAAESGTGNFFAVPRTTVPVWTTVT